jgi:hypothetical protein
MTGPMDILIVATNRQSVPKPDWSIFELPAVKADLAQMVAFTPQWLDACWVTNRAALAPLLDRWGQPNSDYYPVLDLGGEGARFANQSAAGFARLGDGPFDPVAALVGRRLAVASPARVPVPSIGRMSGLAVGAMLRAQVPDSLADAELRTRYSAARERDWRFRATLAQAAPPPEWPLWIASVYGAYSDRHNGSAGVADEAFFADLQRYLDAHRAPTYARDAVAFLHGIAAWDFRQASAAADRLLPAMESATPYLPPDLFLDGAVVAKLRTGDVAGARLVLDGMRRRTGRNPGDLRLRLLDAYVSALEQQMPPGARVAAATRGG